MIIIHSLNVCVCHYHHQNESRRDLEEAEDQFQMALRTHLQNIDTLIQLHDSRLYSLEKNFQTDLKTMQSDFHLEKDKMLTKFRQEKKELTAVIETIESDENDREAEAKHSFEQLREEIRNRNLEEINMLRISLDAQIEELEQHFETAHLNYLQQTAQRTHDFKELTQNDQRLSHEIELKKKKIDNLQTNIQQWRAKIRQLNRETEERNRLLLEEKHSIQKHYQQLKQRIQAYRGTQNQRLLQLSQSANSCKSALKFKLELAARVLQMAELARKMETEQEQVLPFASEVHMDETAPPSPVATGSVKKKDKEVKDKKEQVSTAQSSVWAPPNSTTPPEEQFVPPEDRMSNFHRKYNKALLDTIAIDKEKQRLTEENAQLQDLITQFINGTRVSDAILSDDNPLFVINGRANLNHNPPVRAIRPTIQDAATIQNTAMISKR
jgi:dynein regulatory complex subunit 2